MDIGDTFLLRDRDIEEHFWIVISHPGQDPDRVVIVSLTTHTNLKDGSCILQPADHLWIRHPSCVSYEDAKCVPESQLDALVRSGALVPQEPASDSMIGKILLGAELTNSLPNKCLKVLILQELVNT